MEELIKLLQKNDIEVTDDLENSIKKIYPEKVDTDDLFTQEDLNDVVKKRLNREQKLHEQEINDLKGEMEGLVDPVKVKEYETKIEEFEGKAEERTTVLKKQYELQLAATKAGVTDQEYFEFLVEKNGLKSRLKTDDEGNIVVTDKEGNIITEDGKKLGPSKLLDELKKDKPDLFTDKKKADGTDIGGGGNPPDGTDKSKKKNTENFAVELGYKKKDKE